MSSTTNRRHERWANLRRAIIGALLAAPPKRGELRAALEAIAATTLTFLEANVEELSAIVGLAIDLGVDRVKGHHLWAHFDEIKDQSMRRSRDAIERWNGAVHAARHVAAQRQLPNGEHILLENIFPLDPYATNDLAPGGPSPLLGQEAWISALGRFDPCCAPDVQRRTLGDFGNVGTQSLTEIWDGDRYRELTGTYRNRQLCVGCNMRKPVGGTA